MVISDRYEYVFLELPNTATVAIHQELCEHYEGIPVLAPGVGRHIHYHQFLETAEPEQREYFAFSCIRNPLDVVVTNYFKLRTNQGGIFTEPSLWKRNGGWVTDRDLQKFQFIRETDADFAAYFRRYYRFPPYDNWSSLAHRELDFVIRFENLQDDFFHVLELLGIEPKRPLPVRNKTAGREEAFWSYYTPEIRRQAVRVFGPFMKMWGYGFPSNWGDCSVPWLSQALFRVIGTLRRRLEWGSGWDGRLFRKASGL